MENSRYFLKNEKVSFRAIEKDDIFLIANWLNDGEITYFMVYGQKPASREQIMAWMAEQQSNRENVVFMINELKTGKSIGLAGLHNIEGTARKAEFRILIGEKDFQGKGYGTSAVKLITFYGFDRLNLNRIYSGFVSENKAAEGAYKNAGYIYEGTFRDDVYRNGRYCNVIKISILAKDYKMK